MPSTGRHEAPAGRWLSLQRFRRDENGATAIEFAIIALPFTALMFAIIETALVFLAGQAMETAVSKSARLIRTGQAQQQNLSAADFKNQICGQIMALFDCTAGLKVDVQTFETFDSMDLSKPVDAEGNLRQDFTYAPGNGGDIVMVRTFYEWPTLVRLLGFDLANMPNGTHLISSAAAFRNEPFPW